MAFYFALTLLVGMVLVIVKELSVSSGAERFWLLCKWNECLLLLEFESSKVGSVIQTSQEQLQNCAF